VCERAGRLRWLVVVVALVAIVGATASPSSRGGVLPVLRRAWRGVHVLHFVYRAHDGAARNAYVLLPAWYGRRDDPPLPFVVSPHGRGVTARADCNLWGVLPTVGRFGVVCPEGQGRRLRFYSWGAPGQIDDLARMVAYMRAAVPWIRVQRRRVYAVGGSMGGQEALLAAARFPRRFAGVIAFDAVANFARQYDHFPLLRCNARCLHVWAQPIGDALQRYARIEVGGSPATDPLGYELRSPLHYARRLAFAHIPIELWWSKSDLIVSDQQAQSGALFARIRRLNPHAAVEAFVGAWRHSAEQRAATRLPFALAQLDLMPARFLRRASRLHEHHFIARRLFAAAAVRR
jgi:pimeloyl-ACP methyl ester carboxylesterase